MTVEETPTVFTLPFSTMEDSVIELGEFKDATGVVEAVVVNEPIGVAVSVEVVF